MKIQNERFVWKCSVKPVSVGGCRNSGSTKKNRVSVVVPVQQWVKRRSVPSVKFSPDYCLLGLESVGSQFILDASGVTVELQCELAEIGKNESLADLVVTDELKVGGASTGLQWEIVEYRGLTRQPTLASTLFVVIGSFP
ncbi:hypothetical protein E3N88_29868 [Mikania micrantha]|uniref:Uncharacterized protein n=1 Tax=Mikania micrantha TaxID=192012 RepID=A0A5N6MK08_9ASTR|nr:hypothetical protein E3N88_29868 [Mikania micrantha]